MSLRIEATHRWSQFSYSAQINQQLDLSIPKTSQTMTKYKPTSFQVEELNFPKMCDVMIIWSAVSGFNTSYIFIIVNLN